jgi:lantibiotic modifying enzyme
MNASAGVRRLAWLACAFASSCRSAESARSSPLSTLAEDAARWIQRSAQRSDEGTRWPANPEQPGSTDASLYAGAPGVVLFLLELHRATGKESYLDEARSGADALVAQLGSFEDPGLYTGLAGVGFTLLEVQRATGEPRYRAAAENCVRLLCSGAHEAGGGLEWNATTDVIAGSAGIGLFLLHAAHELGEPGATDVARRAGVRLIELAETEERGLSWAMEPSFPRRMPNFSHGTAGVAYFLARLYEETGEERFLAAARAGADYLLAIADTQGEVCRIYHDEPDGKELYYLGWCHGPVGTARLFYLLYRITGDESWWVWVRRAANALETSGIPEGTTPGFWNNAGPCCGLAGVAEFFLDLHLAKGERSDLEFSRRVTRILVARATRDELGARWLQAEHRVKPAELAAQTGWMQGAAGIGAWLLRLDGFEHGDEVRIALPDSPF